MIARTGGLLPASWLVGACVETLRQGPRLQALPRVPPTLIQGESSPDSAAPGSQSRPLEPAAPAMPPHGTRATAPAVESLACRRRARCLGIRWARGDPGARASRGMEWQGLARLAVGGRLETGDWPSPPSCCPPKIPYFYAGVRLPFSWTRRPGVEMKSRTAPDNAFSGPVSLQNCNVTRFPDLEKGSPLQDTSTGYYRACTHRYVCYVVPIRTRR